MHAKGISSVSFVEKECPQDDNRENLYSNGTDLVTNANGSRGVGFFLPPFVCLFFCRISQKPMKRGSPNNDIQTFHDESWKPISFGQIGVKR